MRDSPTRLEQLRKLLVLDTPRERAYDEIAQTLAARFDVPIAIVNLLDEKRDWFKSCFGLIQSESLASTSLCETFFKHDADVIVVENTTVDERFSRHPFVLGPPFIRFYAAARLTVNGQTMGTLCAYDLVPKKISLDQIEELRALAATTASLLKQRPFKKGASS